MLPDLIVVTDLDATLLDHHNYSFAAAMPALDRLQVLNIPLILNSSKTAAEMLEIRQELKTEAPFIVENGAAVILPDSEGLQENSLGMNRAEILTIIHSLREKYAFCFSGFADMTVAELVEHTGLSETAAKLAMQRQFTEPLVWQDTEEQRQLFTKKIKAAGLSVVKGGRFLHVSSISDKGKALLFLQDYYQKQKGRVPKIIALGDSENDLAMLTVSDFPVLVKSPVRDFPEFSHQNLRKTSLYGPEGWNQAVLEILTELEAS